MDWADFFARILPHVDVISPSVDDLRAALPDTREPSLGLAREYAGWLVEHGAAVAMVTAGRFGVALRAGTQTRMAQGGRVLADLAGQ